MRRRVRPLGGTLLLLLILSAAAPAIPHAVTEDPWAVIEALRQQWQRQGSVAWDFTQTFVPAGFSSGEEESGRVVLDLPRCLRWDYRDPYPKSYLLCGDELRAWNPGEPLGRVYPVDRLAQPGLDLLLLDVDRLRRRYDASLRQEGKRGVRVRLEPRGGAAGPLREAELLVDPGKGRLLEMTYRDADGNRTRFRFRNRRPGPGDDVFEPPAGVRWERES
ncbi:MAG TPA: outer membrane lipoprotein carrier protein LolA [Thermoanaerobaculia bacterium]|nr:outer membrane lipoprotein carrier protein LolA [Thermoanaerobaculia bacterium]